MPARGSYNRTQGNTQMEMIPGSNQLRTEVAHDESMRFVYI